MLSVLIIIIIHNLCVVLLSGVHKLNALYNILKDLDQSPEMVFYYSGIKKKHKKIKNKKNILIDKWSVISWTSKRLFVICCCVLFTWEAHFSVHDQIRFVKNCD